MNDDRNRSQIIRIDTALLSAGVTPDSFDFEEQRLAEAFRELPLMRRRILEMLFVEELP